MNIKQIFRKLFKRKHRQSFITKYTDDQSCEIEIIEHIVNSKFLPIGKQIRVGSISYYKDYMWNGKKWVETDKYTS